MAGQPGLSMMADFVEGREKKVSYSVFAFINTNAVGFLAYAPAADLEAFKPQFEAIMDSLKTSQ